MYFILSKFFLFLLLPIYWVIALLLIALFSKQKKQKRRFFIPAGVVFYLFSIPILLNTYESIWDIRKTKIDNARKYSCVIVLGGFSGSGGEGGGHFNSAADRFIQGVKLLIIKKASHILISGGNGSLVQGRFREATWVQTQLHQFNIPDSLILVESNSKNTIENAKFSKVLLEKSHLAPPYLLVTSAFHMRRAQMIFKNAGMDVVAYPGNFMSFDNSLIFTSFIPNSEVLYTWEFYTKELVGYIVNSFK